DRGYPRGSRHRPRGRVRGTTGGTGRAGGAGKGSERADSTPVASAISTL
ncbi:MAG: hypothetical protein AVDCRST_MAG59-980, partial [uncultured Thermomicrobiales bacterium]